MSRIVRLTVIALLMGQASAPGWSQATPQASQPTKPIGTCEGLNRDWRAIEYGLAENYADGVADDSAPRATMRAARDTEAYVRANITLNLMMANKCPLPKRAPSEMTYSLDAMKCSTEKLKGNYKATECDYSTWTPIGQ